MKCFCNIEIGLASIMFYVTWPTDEMYPDRIYSDVYKHDIF